LVRFQQAATGARRAFVRRAAAAEEGTASVEFALVAVLFLTFLFGVVAYGIQFASRLAIAQAASEGARASIAGLTDAERIGYATAAAQAVLDSYGGLVDPAATTVVAAPVAGDASRFRVTVTHDLGAFALAQLVPFVPVPMDVTTASVTVNNGGL